MRVIENNQIRSMDNDGFASWSAAFIDIVVDLGSGDARFVHHLAARQPTVGAIGLDLSAALLRRGGRRLPANSLLVVADALAPPPELRSVASRLTIHFPWGSLLRALLLGQPDLVAGLRALGRPGATLEVLVNADAMTVDGSGWDADQTRVASVLTDAGLLLDPIARLGPADLRRYPTTWARRLAFGRDPRAIHIAATFP